MSGLVKRRLAYEAWCASDDTDTEPVHEYISGLQAEVERLTAENVKLRSLELTCLQLRDDLTTVKANRDFWHESCQKAWQHRDGANQRVTELEAEAARLTIERDEARQVADHPSPPDMSDPLGPLTVEDMRLAASACDEIAKGKWVWRSPSGEAAYRRAAARLRRALDQIGET